MEFAPTLALAALVISIINFLKYVRSLDWNGVLTQLIVWVAGVVALVLAAATQFASGISVGDTTLDKLNGPGLIFVGLSLASIGSFATEIKKALDQSDSAAKPPLIK